MTDTLRVPAIVVFVQDVELTGQIVREIQTVTLSFHEKKADSGTLMIRDVDATFLDSRVFTKGREIRFIMGWSDDLQPRGPYIIKDYTAAFPESGEQTLTVTFQDKSHRMNKKQKQRRFDNLSPEQIVKRLAQEHGLGYDLETIEGVSFSDDFPIIQANATDAAFMQRLAERYGYVWGVEGDTLYFRRPLTLDELDQQGKVPVLSYRINDQSLKSFAPKIKFTSGRKRKGAKTKQSNLDVLDGATFSLDSARESVSKIPGIGETLQSLLGEEVGDDEPSAGSDAVTSGVEHGPGKAIVDIASGLISYVKDSVEDVLESFESEPGDISAAATPANEDEARSRGAARVVRASEIITGIAIPRIASMRWRGGSAVDMAGLGQRMSGRYRVVAGKQIISPGQTFVTALEIAKRTFRPSAVSQANEDATTADAGSGTQKPDPTNAREESVFVDIASGLVKLIDGKEDVS